MKRPHLIQKRKEYKLKQEEVASFLEITNRHYQALEAGTSDGSVKIWQLLAQKFNCTIDSLLEQRIDDIQQDFTTEKDSTLAAARLADVPSEDMVLAERDLRDGHADTDEGRRVLGLMRAVGGMALA